MDIWNGVNTCQNNNWRLLDKSFELRPIKERSKTSIQHFKSSTDNIFILMAQQFTTAPTSFNSYISCIINNMDLITITEQQKKGLDKEVL